MKTRSKTLSFWLRHRPEAAGLMLDKEGWADVQAILLALTDVGLPTTTDLLKAVVERNDKRRFELSEDGTRIRARQGHSIEVDGGWETATPPDKLYHGTVEKFLPSIQERGLTKQGRHHVHLSADWHTAISVGQRRGHPIVLTIDTKAMAADGYEFAKSSNGVWLVEAVPARYLNRSGA